MNCRDSASILLILVILLSGCISQIKEIPQTETPTPSPIPTEPPKPNAIVEYAKDKLSQEVIVLISPADKDGILDEIEKSVVDYLKMLPEEKYRKIAAQEVMRDSVLTKEDVTFLANYSNSISKSRREMEDLEKDNFTLEDGVQTELEKKYVGNPKDQQLAGELKNDYLEKIKVIYPELASELKKLPEFVPLKIEKKSLEALEDIYGLLLTAQPYKNYNDRFKPNIPKENETWEAFELMINGGTPDQKDFTYDVPKYNTELQALLWIAKQNEFKKNDTLAQSIAMDNGLYITMGDEQVRAAVYKDTNDLLNFFRETNLWQLEKGFYLLEDYPLEAKVVLGWKGDQSSVWSYHDPRDYLDKKMTTKPYKWVTIDLNTLNRMRNFMFKNEWVKRDVYKTVEGLESYFKLNGINWIYTGLVDETITINDETLINHNFNNADLEFEYFLKYNKGIGVCSDQTGLLNALLKSCGIPTSALFGSKWENDKKVGNGDVLILFFDSPTSKWKATSNSRLDVHIRQQYNTFYIVKPKINLKGLRQGTENPYKFYVFSNYMLTYKDAKQVSNLFIQGASTISVKKWLLYL